MAKALTVEVYPRRPSLIATAIRQIAFWTILVGAVGVSRVWFGGAFVIDLAAFLLLVVWMVTAGMRLAGKTVALSREQVVDWVRAGAPEDVKTWKANFYG